MIRKVLRRYFRLCFTGDGVSVTETVTVPGLHAAYGQFSAGFFGLLKLKKSASKRCRFFDLHKIYEINYPFTAPETIPSIICFWSAV